MHSLLHDIPRFFDSLPGGIVFNMLTQLLSIRAFGRHVYVTSANSAEPDQMPHNAASNQDVHCLLRYFFLFDYKLKQKQLHKNHRF